jgi:RNA polymerase sigma-70 factor (ECF subfamily)
MTQPASTPTEAAEDWLESHGDVLYRYALRQLRDEHKAEEMVQETLLAALQAKDKYQGGASVRTWLIGILKHKVMDQFRRDAREVSLDDEPETASSDQDFIDAQFKPDGHWDYQIGQWGQPEATLSSDQFLKILQFCLDALPQRQARLFLLRDFFEEKTEIVCKELSVTPTNLWTILYRARMKLRKCLDENWVGGR